MKVMRLSLARSGGVMERPGEADGVAAGVGLRLLRRMDCGVNAEKTGPEAARARARWQRGEQKVKTFTSQVYLYSIFQQQGSSKCLKS